MKRTIRSKVKPSKIRGFKAWCRTFQAFVSKGMLGCWVYFLSGSVFASSLTDSDHDMIASGLISFLDMLGDTYIRLLGIIAIALLGIQTFIRGKLDKTVAGWTIFGITVALSAGFLYEKFAGSTG